MAFALVEYECFQSLAKEGHVTKDHGLCFNVITKSVTKFGYIILIGFGFDQTQFLFVNKFCNQFCNNAFNHLVVFM